MLELVQEGIGYAGMEEGMKQKGYDKQSIVDALSDPAHAVVKDRTMLLMSGLSQKEMNDKLFNEEGGISAFGNISSQPNEDQVSPCHCCCCCQFSSSVI